MDYKERQKYAKQFPEDKEILGKVREDWITDFLQTIERENILGFEELISHYPFSKTWFYYNGFNEFNLIKSAIDKNKTKAKVKMLKKWIDNENNASLQFGAFKILGTREERIVLSNSKEVFEEEQTEAPEKINLSKLSDEELKLFISLQEKAKE